MPAATALPAISVNPSFSQRLAGLDQAQKMRLAVGIVLFVVIGVVGLVMGRQAEWRVLYANLADKDGGAIVAQLTTMNVPYKIADGGGAILVPADRVYNTRLQLASQGLPKGSVTGFELMDSANRFGMTQFQERLTFQRGLEGELTRSIQALSSVQSARVHLALPNQNGFFREQQRPSASVVVGMNAGRSLDRGQLAGIVHLVSASVPEMDPKSVSVLDDTGKLLSTPPDDELGMGGDAQQLQYVQQIEQNGLLKNLFVYLDNGKTVTTWDAESARFGRVDGLPVLTMQNGSMQRYSSRAVLNQLSFDQQVFDLSPYTKTTERIRFKPSDLWLTELFNPSPALLESAGTRGELMAEAHSRMASPLYALAAMALALTAILGGSFSRTGYSGRIAKAAGVFLVVRVIGYGLVAASAWNSGLNLLQYLLPLATCFVALRLLFRALKPHRRRVWAPVERFKARFA